MSDDAPANALYVECQDCGGRWVLSRLPAWIDTLARAARHTRCPHCGGIRIVVCRTHGPYAVTAPRGPVVREALKLAEKMMAGGVTTEDTEGTETKGAI